MDMGDMNLGKNDARVKIPYGEGWSWSVGARNLVLSVQDTEDGKGVKN